MRTTSAYIFTISVLKVPNTDLFAMYCALLYLPVSENTNLYSLFQGIIKKL